MSKIAIWANGDYFLLDDGAEEFEQYRIHHSDDYQEYDIPDSFDDPSDFVQFVLDSQCYILRPYIEKDIRNH